MSKLPNLPDNMKNVKVILPTLKQIIGNSSFPAYLRLVAADIHQESYATVGSVLANMCPQDIESVLGCWVGQLKSSIEAAEDFDGEDGEENPLIVKSSSPAIFDYLMFCMVVERAEAGDSAYDPVKAGFLAELMASFLHAMIVSGKHDKVDLDLTKFTLGFDFLDQNFDHVISTDNFKAKQHVADIKKMWKKMRDSEILKEARGKAPEPKKDEPIASPVFQSISKGKFKGSAFAKSLPKSATENSQASTSDEGQVQTSKSDLSSLEARLKKLSGGQ